MRINEANIPEKKHAQTGSGSTASENVRYPSKSWSTGKPRGPEPENMFLGYVKKKIVLSWSEASPDEEITALAITQHETTRTLLLNERC